MLIILKQNGMNTLKNNYDSIEQLIYADGLRILAVDFHKELDLMLIVLNTKAILHQKISTYSSLKNATDQQLSKYELIGEGTGIHWDLLDEDLSLKGFLKDELKQTVNNSKIIVAA
jgi:Protein of unknown function (DUF2442)